MEKLYIMDNEKQFIIRAVSYYLDSLKSLKQLGILVNDTDIMYGAGALYAIKHLGIDTTGKAELEMRIIDADILKATLKAVPSNESIVNEVSEHFDLPQKTYKAIIDRLRLGIDESFS